MKDKDLDLWLENVLKACSDLGVTVKNPDGSYKDFGVVLDELRLAYKNLNK